MTVCLVLGLMPAPLMVYAASISDLASSITLWADAACTANPVGTTTYTYNGSEIRPYVKVLNGSTQLIQDTDYEVTYSANTNAANADAGIGKAPTVTIKGIGSYTGSTSKTFTINKRNLNAIKVEYELSDDNGAYCYYTNSSGNHPTIKSVTGTGTNGSTYSLAYRDDYTVEYYNDGPVFSGLEGEYQPYLIIKSAAGSNFSYTPNRGSYEETYRIFYNMANVAISGLDSGSKISLPYTGAEQRPNFTLTNTLKENVTLTAPTNFTYEWKYNTDISTSEKRMSLFLYGVGDYKGTKQIDDKYEIVAAQITEDNIFFDKEFDYTGEAIDLKSYIKVKLGDFVVPELNNYKISYSQNYNGGIGNQWVTINSLANANIKGSPSVEFQIYGNIVSCTPITKEFTYNGSSQTPSLTVLERYGGTVPSSGYSVNYYDNAEYTGTPITNPTAVGTYYIEVVGKKANYYKGTVGSAANPISFKIVPRSFGAATFKINGNQWSSTTTISSTYEEGKSKLASMKNIEVIDNGTTLGSNDYTVSIHSDAECKTTAISESTTDNFVNAGTYYIKITGKGSYLGAEQILSYTIDKRKVTPTITVKPQSYTGQAITPALGDITVEAEGKTIDTFEVRSCTDNVNIGTANIIIQLNGNYTTTKSEKINGITYEGTANGTFQIVPRKISDCQISELKSIVYNGQLQTPTVVVKDGNRELSSTTDYTIGYYSGSACTQNQKLDGLKDVGNYWIKITGINAYASSETGANVIFACEVKPKSINDTNISFKANSLKYSGITSYPTLEVKFGDIELNRQTDFTAEYYSDAACVGETVSPISGQYYVKITGTGNYTESRITWFYIGDDITLLNPTIEMPEGTKIVYNTLSHYNEIANQIMVKGSTGEIINPNYYSVHYYSDKEHKTEVTQPDHNLFKKAGTIYVVITGKNGYYGSVSGEVKIEQKSLLDLNLNAFVLGTYVYTGTGINLTINEGTDASKTDGIQIQYCPTGDGENYVYLTKNDYGILNYTSNTNAGTATVTVKAVDGGNYKDSRQINFTIYPKNVNDLANLRISIPEATYTSRRQEPVVNVMYGDQSQRLYSGTHFEISYFADGSYSRATTDLTNAGSVFVKITGTGNYTGVATNFTGSAEYKINKRPISDTKVDIEGLSYIYNQLDASKIPAFTVKYEYATGVFYQLPSAEYTWPTSGMGYKVGVQEFEIDATDKNFTGSKRVTFISLGNMDNSADEVRVDGIAESYAYTGGEVKCSNIVVYSKKTGQVVNSDYYNVTYRSNDRVGTATIEIKGKSEYYWTGTYTQTFKITGTVADAQITIPTQLYTGDAYTAADIKSMQVTCGGYTLEYDKDYDIISIVNGTNASLATAANAPELTIRGKGDYFTGTATKSEKFAIKYDMNSTSLQVAEIPDQLFTGKPVTPEISVKYKKKDNTFADLAQGEALDYTVTYFKNTAVARANGTAGPYVVIASTGKGLLTAGSVTASFGIGTVNLADPALGYYIEGIQEEYLYTKAVIKPTVVVKNGAGEVLTQTGNYQVDYSPANQVEAGSTVTIKITGIGNYYGVLTTTFKIVTRTLDTDKDEVTVTIPDQTYTGKPITPSFNVEAIDHNGKTVQFKLNEDYIIVGYYNNTNAAEAGIATDTSSGRPYVKIQAMQGRSLVGERVIPFTILPKSMESLVYTAVPDLTYEPGRTEYKPEVKVKLAKESTDYLVEGVDYRAIYHNYTLVADANGANGPYIEIIPYDTNENLTGTKIITYSVKKKSIKSADIVVEMSDTDTSKKFDPIRRNYPEVGTYNPTIRIFDYANPDSPVELRSGEDFSIGSFTGNGSVGTVTIPISGKKNYADEIRVTFTIGTLFDTDHISITQNNSPLLDGKFASATYNGTTQLPDNFAVKVISTARELTVDTDYSVSIYMDEACTKAAAADNVCNAGTYYFSIKGLTSAGFIGSIVVPYTINQKSVNDPTVKVAPISNQSYGNGIVKPIIDITDEETGEKIPTSQYEVTYQYEGRAKIGATYAVVTANANGNYTGSRPVDFTIIRQDIADANVYPLADRDYTGEEIEPDPQVYFGGIKLEEGKDKDYIVKYGNNVSAGKAWIIIQGQNNYTGVSKEIGFKIKANLEHAIVSSVPNQLYTGKQVKPKVTSVSCGGNKLVEGTDYILDYEPNIIIGDGAIIILPKNDYYTGSKVVKFNICNTIEAATITNIPTSQTYTTSAITPEPTVKVGNTVLKKDVHYTVRWGNDVNVGTASLTVTGIGAYGGTKIVNYRIIAKSIARCSVSDVSNRSYTGKVQTPGVVVKDGKKVLAEGNDYTVSYLNNKNIGTATITVIGKGNYSGSVVKKFDIVSAPITGLKASNQKKTTAKLSWAKASNITGYQVYTNDAKKRVAQTTKTSVTIKKLKSGTTYKYKVRTYTKIGKVTYYGDFKTITFATQPEKVAATVKSSKTKTAVVSWKKVAGSNGYEIYCSTSKKGTYQPVAYILRNNVLNYTQTGLKKGKTYYYRVRAYRSIDGKKVYGAFSDIGSVKVK